MTKPIRTGDAREALQGIIRREIEQAAGPNGLLAEKEAKGLSPFVARAEKAVRADMPKHGRVRPPEVVDRAMTEAMATWDAFNPPSKPRDAAFLSKAEVEAIAAADPELGTLTRAAYMAAGSPSSPEKLAKLQAFLVATPGIGDLLSKTSSFGQRLHARPGEADRASLPAGVVEAYDRLDLAEQADWAGVTLKSVRFAGQDLYAVHLGTDGDEGRLELLDPKGEPVLSGRLQAGDWLRTDEFFGLGRHAGSLGLLGATNTEGYSEDDERLAAGQITSAWTPEWTVENGSITHDAWGVTGFATHTPLTPERRELVMASLELMYTRSLQHRANGSDPIDLGSNATLRLGSHTNPNDGKQYLVVDYVDIDDDSRTLYFQRSETGRLHLAIDQYNN
jgi:hypothetical protein